MDTPLPSVPPVTAAPVRRQAAPRAASRTEEKRARRGFGLLLPLLGTLIIGLALGAVIERRHFHAHSIVLSVNGANIDADAFYHRLQLAAGNRVASQMVTDQLTLQYAKKQHAVPTMAAVDAQYAETSRQPSFAQKLAATGESPADFKAALQVQMAKEALLSGAAKVTEADARKFYAANSDPHNRTALYYTPESLQAAAIVTKTEAQAQQALAQLNRGLPFATVVHNFSQDTSKANNGLVPVILRGRSRVSQIPGMEDALFGMKIGGQIGPRQFTGVWWILRCLDKKPSSTRPYVQVKDECWRYARLAAGAPANAKKVQAEFKAFRKAARVQAFWPQYESVTQQS